MKSTKGSGGLGVDGRRAVMGNHFATLVHAKRLVTHPARTDLLLRNSMAFVAASMSPFDGSLALTFDPLMRKL
jgi:hypothetical protein